MGDAPGATLPEAERDPLRLYDHFEERSGPARALAKVERIRRQCAAFGRFPERGTRRDDVSPGLRTVGFERRVAIACSVEPDAVLIVRALYGGRDLKAALDDGQRPRPPQPAAASLKAT